MYEILDNINNPKDLKNLSSDELNKLCGEIRGLLVETVTKNGGHLASNLGVVELTVALCLVFDFPDDKIIWDVGHQSYVYKILTGRKDRFDTLRKYGGLSGFPKTSESEYDAFNTGHASTSVSAAVGMARARDLKSEKFSVCAVFGDGALTGGMIYEALNDVGHRKTPIVLILNDNEMSISKNVGALSKYLLKIRQTHGYYKSKKHIEDILNNLPFGGRGAKSGIQHIKNTIRSGVLPSTFFEDLGINYLGPVDGHNIDELKSVISLAKDMNEPVIVHTITKKGKGYTPAENNPQSFHGISPQKADEGKKIEYKDYSECFGQKLTELAAQNKNFAAITAAMRSGVGLLEFSKKYPKRFFDTGIAEEHAITLAAGLAKEGIVPVFAVYSSFLQRGYDQLLHDVCLQNLHAVFMVDRAGVVGADGETHHGLYDIAFLSTLPNMTVLSPSSFAQFEEMTEYAICQCNTPIAIRYPRGNISVDSAALFRPNEFNSVGDDSDILLITSGRMLKTALKVRENLQNKIKVIELTTVFPIPDGLSAELEKAKTVITLEDHTIRGGIATLVAEKLSKCKNKPEFYPFAYPNNPIVHGNVSLLDKHYSLDADSITKAIKSICGGTNG